MSNNRIVKIFNCLFWYSLYMLPLLTYLFVSIRVGEYTSFQSVFSTLGLGIVNDNIIYQALDSIFGSTSEIMPLFTDSGVLVYVSYMASVYLVHFVVDVLLWLVRWAHDFLHKDNWGNGGTKW